MPLARLAKGESDRRRRWRRLLAELEGLRTALAIWTYVQDLCFERRAEVWEARERDALATGVAITFWGGLMGLDILFGFDAVGDLGGKFG